MRSRAVLALLALALPLALARFAAAPPPGPALRSQVGPSRRGGRRGGTGRPPPALTPPLPRRAAPAPRDMHDFFVGLMGKRMAEPGRTRFGRFPFVSPHVGGFRCPGC
uniref:Uncharacterized protein n=1 Tax=Anas zonorhyncha TaxID=75864 RepID=A0A8B9VAS9_9AVES